MQLRGASNSIRVLCRHWVSFVIDVAFEGASPFSVGKDLSSSISVDHIVLIHAIVTAVPNALPAVVIGPVIVGLVILAMDQADASMPVFVCTRRAHRLIGGP